MKANKLKTLIMGEYIYGKGYIGLFTEAGYADVLGIRNSRFLVEFEIKVSKSDLQRELNCIQEALMGKIMHPKTCKYRKHQGYLLNKTYWGATAIYRPNLFYFVVPMELEKIAIEGVKDTPYGVLAYGDWEYILHFSSGDQTREGHGFKESVKAKHIHKEKKDEKFMVSLIRKATVELYETRKKLYLVEAD